MHASYYAGDRISPLMDGCCDGDVPTRARGREELHTVRAQACQKRKHVGVLVNVSSLPIILNQG